MAGSTGVLPAPKGYLKRLREITQKHGILLIFDEVITGYGRLGFAFAAERYGVLPDMLTFAKGITNGAAPMGGVLVRDTIHDAFMSGPEHMVELTHGYTYSAHPLACAAALATLDIYRDEKLFERANKLEPKFADAVMSLKGQPNVVDIRTVGLTAGIDLAPRAGRCRQARLRRAEQRLPRQRPDAAHRRRHAGADPAPDRQRGPDRRDRRARSARSSARWRSASSPLLSAEARLRATGSRQRAHASSPHASPKGGGEAERGICHELRFRACQRTLASRINIGAKVAALGGAQTDHA